MVRSSLALIFALSFGANLYAQTLTWSEVTHDTDDLPIPSGSIYYKLYYNTGQPPFIYTSDVSDISVDLSQAPEGCYNLRVTAVRTDTTPPLESAPSQEVFGCVGSGSQLIVQPQAPEDINYE